MKIRFIVPALLIGVLALGAGWLARGRFGPPAGERAHSDATPGDGPCRGGIDPLYWKAPMDPNFIRDEPGKSPMGMDLVPVCPDEVDDAATNTVRINPGLIQSMGVRTAPIVRRDLARTIRTVGRVDYDERRVSHVHSKVQGWVEKLHVEYAGQMVEAGAPLLDIYSPELVSTQEELLVAVRYRDSTSESPFPDVRVGGAKLFEATRRRLELWDIPKRDIDRLLKTGNIRKTLTLYAPSSGVVTHMMVREGMEIGSTANLYTIADLSHVWVYADVYEYELPWVAVGQKGTVELSYLPDQRFEGDVTYIYPFLDPKTRTARVRIELRNRDLILKPEMFANVTIDTEVHPDVLAVPEEAVIRSGRRNLVMIALGGGRFQPREVVVGLETGDGWVEVRKGVSEDERVVTSGQFLIDSESKLQEAVQKLLARESPGAEGAHAEDTMPSDSGSGEE